MVDNKEQPGQKLRRARERLGLRYRDVKEASIGIAQAYGNNEFQIGLSRLADIETKGTVPSLFRLYSLCAIYKLSFNAVLRWYGIDLEHLAVDARHFSLRSTTVFDMDAPERFQFDVPLGVGGEFDNRKTSFLGEQMEKWGKTGAAMMGGIEARHGRYGLLGTDDWSMWPLIPPGSILHLDDRKTKPAQDNWTTEYDRPIYFIEHRERFQCGWCSLRGDQLIVQAHPSHKSAPQVYRYPGEVDIIGQVIGIATRMGQVKPPHIGFSTNRESLQNRTRASGALGPE